MDYQQARTAMVQGQLKPNGITNTSVLQAYDQLARHQFVNAKVAQPTADTEAAQVATEANDSLAYLDEEVKLAEGRMLLEPAVEAKMIQAAAINNNDLVLLVGAWPGAMAAIAAQLASAVIAQENDATRVQHLQMLFDKLEIINIICVIANLPDGYAARGPYDVILFGGAIVTTPPAILNQLTVGGRLITVERPNENVPGKLILYRKTENSISRQLLQEAFIPILPEFNKDSGFVF